MDTRATISQDDGPCVLHATHSPITVVNEKHHPFPQEYQRDVWGEVRDDRMAPLCATGHNTIHAALRHHRKHGAWPTWCIGRTRDLGEFAVAALNAARAGGTDPLPWPDWMGHPA